MYVCMYVYYLRYCVEKKVSKCVKCHVVLVVRFKAVLWNVVNHSQKSYDKLTNTVIVQS